MIGEAATVIRLAAESRMRIAVAESLTGGLLLSTLIDVPGASRAVTGGIVAYDTALKRTLLSVDAELLAERGPVDPEVARQMARGAREACAAPDLADIGVATTGVAGPDPDLQTGLPVGTVWIGISSARGDRSVQAELGSEDEPGVEAHSRARIRRATVLAALRELVAELHELSLDSSET